MGSATTVFWQRVTIPVNTGTLSGIGLNAVYNPPPPHSTLSADSVNVPPFRTLEIAPIMHLGTGCISVADAMLYAKAIGSGAASPNASL